MTYHRSSAGEKLQQRRAINTRSRLWPLWTRSGLKSGQILKKGDQVKFQRLHSYEEISLLLQFHNKHSQFLVIDCETSSEDPRECELIDIQISGKDKDSAVIFSAEYRQALQELSKGLTLVGHYYKFDAQVLFRHDIDLLSHRWDDTLILGHLLDENRDSYSLDSYVKEKWGDDYKEQFWDKYQSYQESTEEDRVTYACKDIVYTSRLYVAFKQQLECESIPCSLVTHVAKLQEALLRTEIEGVCIDKKYLEELGVKTQASINRLDPKMRELAKDEIEVMELLEWQKEIDSYKTPKRKALVTRPSFSFTSGPQLQELLYTHLGLPIQYNEKTGNVSTDYESLQKIKSFHPLIPLLQENRDLQKLYTAYVEGTLDREKNGRIYPRFNVAGTGTGRLSHSQPNLAQLPKQGGIRAIYIPTPGYSMISADYDQVEVILEACLTRDKNLIEMIRRGESKHDLTSKELGINRDIAKTLNFALQYWAGPGKVSQILNVSKEEGKQIWTRYWEIYSGPKQYKRWTDSRVDAGVPLQTVFGRRRRFEHKRRSFWDSDYRQAYNFMIQGTGADITHKAFYTVSNLLLEKGIGRTLWSIHDEILIEAKHGFEEECEQILIREMEKVGRDIGLQIPLKAKGSGPMTRWED